MANNIFANNFKKVFTIALTATLIVSGFFVASFALAAHTATVTVDPIIVKGGTSGTYIFDITNDGPDSVNYIKITAPSGFLIQGSLVTNLGSEWVCSNTNSYVLCQVDYRSSQIILSDGTVTMTFSAISAGPVGDTAYNWTVFSYDIAVSNYTDSTTVQTTVDVMAPTTGISEIPVSWVNEDISVILTCDDGIGVGCKEIHYTISDGSEVVVAGSVANFNVSCSEGNVCKTSITYYSIDNFDQVETPEKTSDLIRIDRQAPKTDIETEGLTYKEEGEEGRFYIALDVKFTLSAADEGSGVSSTSTYYKIDDGTDTVYAEAFTLSGLDEGIHAISYWSVDNVGNIEEAQTLTVFVDDADPIVGEIIIEPFYFDGVTNYISATPTISASVNDADGSGIAGCEYTLNGESIGLERK